MLIGADPSRPFLSPSGARCLGRLQWPMTHRIGPADGPHHHAPLGLNDPAAPPGYKHLAPPGLGRAAVSPVNRFTFHQKQRGARPGTLGLGDSLR